MTRLSPDTVIGGCRIERYVGSGNMGDVYLARQEPLDRPVALKVLRPELRDDATYRERFILEARTAARIEDQHVVTIHAAGEDDGQLYMVFRYVEGETLDDRLSRSGPLSPDEVVEVGLAVASALAAAWACGVVHLDIKPANILRASSGRIVVLDFGIARRVVDVGPAGRSRGVSGSPAFMPPEQWQGRRLDGRTDLYALGVTLYQLATGALPIDAGDDATADEWLAAHRSQRPAPMTRPGVPPQLVRLIEGLLEKRADARPPSAVVVGQLLEGVPATAVRGGGVRGLRATADGVAPADAAPGRTPFLGREADIAHAAVALHAARSGRGDVVVLTGPHGVGRSRLLAEAGLVARRGRSLVLAGRCRRRKPLDAIRRIFRWLLGLTGSEDEATVREVLTHRLATAQAADGLAAVRDALEPFLAGDPDAVRLAGSPELPIGVLAGLVRAEARPDRPVVVLVDDLDQADQATLSLVAELAEATDGAPLVVIATVAADETDAADPDTPAAAAIARLANHASLARRDLGPLGRVEIAAIARAVLPVGADAELVELLAEQADGLPKVVVAAVAEAVRRGALDAETGACDRAALRRLAGRVRRGLAARADRDRARPEQTERPTEADRDRLRIAGRQLSLAIRLRAFSDLDGAAAALDRALEQLGDGAPARLEARVRRELARTLRISGTRLEDASAHAGAAVDLARSAGDHRGAVEAAVERALVMLHRQRHHEALSTLDDAAADLGLLAPELRRTIARAGRPRAVQRLPIKMALARGAVLAHLPGPQAAREAEEEVGRAMRTAARVGDQELYARAAQDSAQLRLRAGDAATAARLFLVSARYTERQGDLRGLARACGGLAHVALGRGDRDAAVKWLDRDLGLAIKVADQRGIGAAANTLGELYEDVFLEAKAGAAVATPTGSSHLDEAVAASDDDRDDAPGASSAPPTSSAAAALRRAEVAFDLARKAAARSRNPVDEVTSAFYRSRFRMRCLGADDGRVELRAALERARDLGLEDLVPRIERALEEDERRSTVAAAAAGWEGAIRALAADPSLAPEPAAPALDPLETAPIALEARPAMVTHDDLMVTLAIGPGDDPVLDALIAADDRAALRLEAVIANASPRLVVAHRHHPEPVAITSPELTVGKSVENDIRLLHLTVSRRHARIRWTGGAFLIEDLGTLNGTQVAGRRLGPGERARLLPHTDIWIAGVPCLFLVAELDDQGRPGPSANANLVVEYLVKKEWIGRHQSKDELRLGRGDADAIGARLVGLQIVTPEQWAEAYRAARLVEFLR